MQFLCSQDEEVSALMLFSIYLFGMEGKLVKLISSSYITIINTAYIATYSKLKYILFNSVVI